MLAFFSPTTGRVFNFVSLFAYALIVTACAPKESVVDSWKLSPPTLELTNARGITLKLKVNEVRSAQAGESNSFIDESAILRFAPVDRGFPVTFKSRCSSGEIKTEEHIETQITSDRVSVLGLIPPLTLAPENLVREWQCNLKMQVTNSTGSRSGGELRDLRLNFSALAARLASTNAQPAARSDIKRRLICPTWWTDGSHEALDVLSRGSVVSGVDTREYERQPPCSVIELGSMPKVAGLYRPVFAGARITITAQRVLIPVAQVPDLYRRKLFSWTIKNEERFPQTIFIQASQDSVKFAAVIAWGPDATGLTRPVRVFPKFSQTGGTEVRETPAGYYIRLAAGSSAVVEMNSNRASTIISLVDFTTPKGVTHLVVTTDLPVSVSAIANEREAKNFSAMTVAELDILRRDPITATSPVLISNVIFEPNRTMGLLAPSNMTPLALAAQRKFDGPECIEGPFGMNGGSVMVE